MKEERDTERESARENFEKETNRVKIRIDELAPVISQRRKKKEEKHQKGKYTNRKTRARKRNPRAGWQALSRSFQVLARI